MKTRTVLVICIGFLLFAGRCLAQQEVDVVYLKNGSKILGTIIEQVPNKQLKIRMRDGSEFVYTFDEIEIIRKETPALFETTGTFLEYTELGVAIGTPAVLNIELGYWMDEVGVRLSGGIFPGAGIQANLGFKLAENAKRSHVIAAVFGASEIDHYEWTYAGVAYELNYHGIFLQAGLTAGRGDYSSPQIIFQLGYVYRFF
jgi:hypothetical protein